MTRLSRRSFLAASAASATLAGGPTLSAPRQPAPPAVPEVPRSGTIETVIIGAGAAGIAAARRLAAANRRFVLLEASDSVGGRCVTDTKTFGVPFDRGAHWIYTADQNPLARLAGQVGLELYAAPPGQRIRIGRRYAREGELEDFLAGRVRVNTAIADAVRKGGDGAVSQVLPKDLGEWRPTIEFALGPYGCGKDLAEVSTADLSRSPGRDNSRFCREGFGTLLSRLASGLPVQLGTPVTGIEYWSRNRLEVQTTKGQFRATAVICTVSTNVLAANKIKFAPDLPRRHLDAVSKLRLGSHDLIALEMTGNPFGLRADELVLEKSESKETAAIFANVGGSSLCVLHVGGSFGRDLTAKGEPAMREFALKWLSGLYGIDMKNAVKRSLVTRWNHEPWILGAISVAAPGAQALRRVLMEPLSNRIFFAGEAVHENLWGTVGGAWETGERAADGVLKLLGIRR
ncbi:MAG: FAD-dependent oxidoreductase [Hyphomicrobiales bacterium]|nr:FAD-dependent oxidoreductase [Hyphomicrobiales bacterium]